jgi:hypothetical protein
MITVLVLVFALVPCGCRRRRVFFRFGSIPQVRYFIDEMKKGLNLFWLAPLSVQSDENLRTMTFVSARRMATLLQNQ